MSLGIDWEELLGADGDDLGDAWEDAVWEASSADEPSEQDTEIEAERTKRRLEAHQAAIRVAVERELAGYRPVIWRGRERLVHRAWSGREFSDDELVAMLEGDAVDVEAVRRDGQRFAARLRLTRHHFQGADGVRRELYRASKVPGPSPSST